MEKLLRSYLKKLTNLTASNRSLLLLKLHAGQDIDFRLFDFADGKPSVDLLEQIIQQKSRIPVCPVVDSRDRLANGLSIKIRQIQRRDEQIWEERGSRDLYVGYPFVEGSFSDGTPTRCPLLFFPVSLVETSGKWVIELRPNECPVFNRSFVLAYHFFNRLKLGEVLQEEPIEEKFQDLVSFKNWLYETLKSAGLEINFTSDLYLPELKDFYSLKREELEDSSLSGKLKLVNQAVLGIFPQAGSLLVPDYEQFILNTIGDDAGIYFSRKYVHSPFPVREDETFTPFALDASQESALIQVKSGQSLVVQGPPGTGKSQLIANLATDFAARGKKVLFVCQKRAALDVVYNRLASIGMRSFVGLVHDHRSDRRMLFDQIASQISQIGAYEEQNNRLDTIYLERAFQSSSRSIKMIADELEGFRNALFDASDAGLSPKELYLNSRYNADALPIGDLFRAFDLRHIDESTSRLERVFHLASHYVTHSAWKKRVSMQNWTIREVKEVASAIQALKETDARLKLKTLPDFGRAIGFTELQDVVHKRILSGDLKKLLTNPIAAFLFDLLVEKKKPFPEQKVKQWKEDARSIFEGEGPERTLPQETLTGHIIRIQKVADLLSQPLGKIGFFFSRERKTALQLLQANQLSDSEPGNWKTLMQMLEKKARFYQMQRQANKSLKDSFFPLQPNRQELDEWLSALENAYGAWALWQSDEALQVFCKNPDKLSRALSGLPELLDEVTRKSINLKPYLTDSQCRFILEKEENGEILIAELESNYEWLIECDRLLADMPIHEQKIFRLFEEKLSETNPVELVGQIKNSLFLAWIAFLEEKTPLLMAASTGRLAQLESELQVQITKKQSLAKDILLMRLRERTYRYTTVNRLQNRITYRELQHQTEKKKKVWPVRKLVTAFKEELFNLIPVWMASPETVSSVFPMEEMFDLVIFDEASQCFAEKGLPSIFRGKQIVVAGDSKQLPPNDLYQPRWEEENEDETVVEAESLLDFSSLFLKQQQLKGHYRSKSTALIAFSNRHFYHDSLNMLPDFNHLSQNSPPALEYRKVAGTWENQVNESEALTVALLVKELLLTNANKEIGIVTFNARQQNLVLDKLEELATDNQLVLPDTLIVKNIENIQGDEKDIIIFSVGYAPDHKGRFVMQFGSLNQAGGENRLNVAVSRARERIIVVSSIFPAQLQVEDTLNNGPKLLKQYLEFVWDVWQRGYEAAYKPPREYAENWFLKSRLKSAFGWEYSSLPQADLALKTNNRIKKLILTDDEHYHLAAGAKEAHGYWPIALQKKSWPYSRWYSRQWWRNEAADGSHQENARQVE